MAINSTEYDELIIEVWELLKEFVPAKQKDDTCVQLLQIFESNGYSPEDCENLHGVDRDIDKALNVLYEIEEGDDEEEEEDY